jgi:drug/metabolite transporter (DMT)-like permease
LSGIDYRVVVGLLAALGVAWIVGILIRGLKQRKWGMALKEAINELFSAALLFWVWSVLIAGVILLAIISDFLESHPMPFPNGFLLIICAISLVGIWFFILIKAAEWLKWKPRKYTDEEKAILEDENARFKRRLGPLGRLMG